MKASKGDWKELTQINQQLLEALEQKQFVEVDRLIKEGAAVNVRFGPSRDSALHYFSDVEIIEKLLNCDAHVNALNSYQETPLMHAVSYYKDVAIVKALIRRGAQADATNRRGETVLSMAIRATCFRNSENLEKTLQTLLNIDCHLKVDELSYAERTSKLIIKFSRINDCWIIPNRIIQNSKYATYADECQAELNLMDSQRLNDSFSLLNIVKNWRRWLPNPSIMKLLENYEEKYPIYADVIFDRIHAVLLERRKLLSRLDAVVVFAKICEEKQSENAEIILNVDCKRQIMKYVSNNDLEVFLSGISTKTVCLDDSQPDAKRAKIE